MRLVGVGRSETSDPLSLVRPTCGLFDPLPPLLCASRTQEEQQQQGHRREGRERGRRRSKKENRRVGEGREGGWIV